MILEVHAEGLRHDILGSNIQEVRALDQNIRQHQDHEAVAALVHSLAHKLQKFLAALEQAAGIDAGDLADAEIVIRDVEILEIRKQQRVRRRPPAQSDGNHGRCGSDG